MKRIFYTFLAFIFCISTMPQLIGQANVFWAEDFTNGMPADWTNEDPSGNEAIFSWCADPATGQQDGCPRLWNGEVNQQVPFASTTATTGFVTMDSDLVGQISSNHQSELTTAAIDCSAQTEVWMTFETHIGVFTLNADTNAVIQVSTDGENFTKFPIKAFENLTTGERWSDNPEEALVDISSVAAGQATVYIQWQWVGNYEYHWSIDDAKLYDADPRVANDMRVNGNFYAIAPNAMTPASQIEPFGFLADIENVGSTAQNNVNLNISITNDSGTEVYTDDLAYGTIGTDSLAENVPFVNSYAPTEDIASYTGTYTVSAENPDDAADNNQQSFQFAVTDSVFAKEMGYTRPITPAASNWNAGEPHSWAYGNHFHVSQADELFIRSVAFGVANAADEGVAGRALALSLYSWVDQDNGDGLDGIAQPEERTLLAITFYIIEGTETPEQLITIPFPEEGEDPIQLTPGTDYLLMLEYYAEDEVDITFSASDAFDYSAMVFASQLLEQPRYGSMLGIAGDITSTDYGSLGFGRDLVPVVRMHVGSDPRLDTNTDNILSDNDKIEVFPNPAQELLNVAIILEETSKEAVVSILNVTGQQLQEKHFDTLKSENFQLDIADLPTGTYFLKVQTDKGSKTVRFVVKN